MYLHGFDLSVSRTVSFLQLATGDLCLLQCVAEPFDLLLKRLLHGMERRKEGRKERRKEGKGEEEGRGEGE